MVWADAFAWIAAFSLGSSHTLMWGLARRVGEGSGGVSEGSIGSKCGADGRHPLNAKRE